jgi:hypothetical protein
MNLLGYLDKAAEWVGFDAGAVSNLYEDSFLSDVIGVGVKAYDKVTDFLDTDFGNKAAGYMMQQLSDPKQNGKMPIRGGRVSSGAGSVGQASYKASAVDMGFTPKVMQAYRNAQNARAGSSIQSAVQRLQTRPSKGPTVALGTSQIKVAPRSRA